MLVCATGPSPMCSTAVVVYDGANILLNSAVCTVYCTCTRFNVNKDEYEELP